MQYRQFGNCGFDVSVLGFGCMRLPVLDGDQAKIHLEQATRLLRYGIDHGINYIDTAYGYHGGKSEEFVGRALQDGYRERVRLATKLPTYLCENSSDFDKYLDEQLERLNTDCIDLYLLHALNKKVWKHLQELDICSWLDRISAQGRIGHAGFSFHDDADTFESIIDAYPWAFCQIQLNYMDSDHQAGVRGLRYAAARGIPVVIMEPIKGGKLGGSPPGEIQAVWNRAVIKRTPAEWALRWVCNFPEATCVLSGMSTMEQLEENLVTVEDAFPHSLTGDELGLIGQARDLYQQRLKIACTDCSYCMPCPQGVAIPQVFSLYNDAFIYQTTAESARWYQRMLTVNRGAASCVECGECEAKCPQQLPIAGLLKTAHQELSRV